jgi:hypothetical protein
MHANDVSTIDNYGYSTGHSHHIMIDGSVYAE